MAILSPLRRCCKCGALKLITSFHKDASRADGYYPQCKACRQAYSGTREAAPMRQCRRCQERKPLTEFHRDRTRGDGWHVYCKACVKSYQKTNAVAQDQYGHDWQQANADKVRHYSREWARRNPDSLQERNRRYRARKLGAQGSFTQAEWEALCNWFGNRCLRCGRADITADHVIPLIKGGSDYIENIQPLCRSCNTSKKDKAIDYRDPDRLAAFFDVYYGPES